MPEFEVERPGKPKPIIVLPRGPIRDENGTELLPSVRIFVELGKGVAGCCFCDAPIPKETTRFCLQVALPIAQFTKSGRERRIEKYYAHSGCLGGLLGQEVKRSKYTCWDCGSPPPQGGNAFGADFHPHSVFTTTKFANARLCSVCARKPKWRQCQGCHTFFPMHMVQRVTDDLEERYSDFHRRAMIDFDVEAVVFYPRVDGGDVYGCEWCVRRAGVTTEEQSLAAREEYERTRRMIAEEGIFGDE
jgi:hypothetical protein